MKKLILEMTIAFAVSLLIGATCDQILGAENKKPVMRMITTGDVFILQEMGAVILPEKDELRIDMVAPQSGRPEGYKSVDLRKDDIILMLNGKKVAALKDLKDGYEALAIGADVKLGIKRDRQMMIVSFAKIDPAKLPKRAMTMTVEGKDGPVTSDSFEVVRLDGAEGKIIPITELGLIIKEDAGKVLVAHVLPNSKEVFDKVIMQEGDQILELNGTKIAAVGDFELHYQKLAVGEIVGLVFHRDGKPVKVEVKKPAAGAQPTFIQKKVTQ